MEKSTLLTRSLYPGMLLLMVAAVVLAAQVRYFGSDPRGTSLLAVSLLEHGSFHLDAIDRQTIERFGGVTREKNGHTDYYFPVGTPIVSIPVVAVANILGVDVFDHDEAFQLVLMVIAAVLTTWLMYCLARLFVGTASALGIAAVFWLGTALSSTGATALWSHNFAVLFGLLAIYLTISALTRQVEQPWFRVALCLFLAYLCRPTMALLAPCLLMFLGSHDWRAAFKTAGALALLVIGFSGYSYAQLGQPLPDYYLPGRLGAGEFPRALWGNLVSPSRGILVFSPFILLAWCCYKSGAGRFSAVKNWYWLGIVWPLLHLIFISRFPHWWGGFSYGPRLMMDALPGLFLLSLRVWPERWSSPNRFASGLLVAGVAFSIYVNAWQGLFNSYSARWNGEPHIDSFSFYLFDWKYPQFLHNESRHLARLADHQRRFSVSNPLAEIDYRDSGHLVSGWAPAEALHRWSVGDHSMVVFMLPAGAKCQGVMVIDASYFGNQRVTVKLNGNLIDRYASGDISHPYKIRFDPGLVAGDRANRIEFELPDAAVPTGWMEQPVALALRKISIQ